MVLTPLGMYAQFKELERVRELQRKLLEDMYLGTHHFDS